MTLPSGVLGTSVPEDDEVSLFEIWKILIEGWRLIIAGIAAGLIAAVGYLVVTPPLYEATALVRIGQGWQGGQIGQIGQGSATSVEPPARVVERVMFPTFKVAMIKKLGWGEGGKRGEVYAGSLKASIARGTDLIELRVRAMTREEALSSMNATIEHLSGLHKAVMQPVLEGLQADLKEVSAEAMEIGKVLAVLDRAAQQQRNLAPRDRFSESILLAQLAAVNEIRLRELRRREVQYRELISQNERTVTGAFAEPSVPDAPVSPKKSQAVMLAVLSGLLLGVLAVLFRHAVRRNRATTIPSLTGAGK